jgi:hypothetical protein
MKLCFVKLPSCPAATAAVGLLLHWKVKAIRRDNFVTMLLLFCTKKSPKRRGGDERESPWWEREENYAK